MKRFVLQGSCHFLHIGHQLSGFQIEHSLTEAFPDMIYSHSRRMYQIFSIEAIVSQLIKQQLIGREIEHHAGVSTLKFINSQLS